MVQKKPESYGSVKRLRETGGIHRPELDGNTWKQVEQTRNYRIVQGPGSVNPYSYPCRHIQASDLWCRRQSDVNAFYEFLLLSVAFWTIFYNVPVLSTIVSLSFQYLPHHIIV